MLAVTGRRTTIVQSLARAAGEPVAPIVCDMSDLETDFLLPDGATRFVLAHGVMHGLSFRAMLKEDLAESVAINLVNTMRLCDHILRHVREARIVVIGSLSGREGSFDETYAACKAGIHAYVSWHLVQAPQLLCAVAPCIIADSGMTTRRSDYPGILSRRNSVTSAQVAESVRDRLDALDCAIESLNNSIHFMHGEPQK